MKTHFFMLLLSALTFQNTYCQNPQSFEINGTVSSNYSGYLYLSYGMEEDSIEVIDNSFFFTGKVEYPIEARIHTRNGFFSGDLYLENSLMTLSVSIKEKITILESLSGNSTELISK